MSDETPDQDGVICPRCSALLVGVTRCPDPKAHRASEPRSEHTPSQLELYGGQQPPYRSWYEQDEKGRAILPFKNGDGEVKGFPVLWNWRDPVTHVRYPWMIDLAFLDREDLLYVTGMRDAGFNAKSAGLPGRVEGWYAVACHTQEFVKEYVFGHLAKKKRWHRVTRGKNGRHHPSCSPSCPEHR